MLKKVSQGVLAGLAVLALAGTAGARLGWVALPTLVLPFAGSLVLGGGGLLRRIRERGDDDDD